jgi:hypothetical protein
MTEFWKREALMQQSGDQVKVDRKLTASYGKTAFPLIMLLGIVSMFGDIAYEGGRSISGPYLATPGASAATVGLVTGAGEFLGYGLRLVSEYLTDRTEAYWVLTFVGYGLIGTIPVLAFTGNWPLAADQETTIEHVSLTKRARSGCRDLNQVFTM